MNQQANPDDLEDMFFIVDDSADTTVLYCNKAVTRHLGWLPEELIGQPLFPRLLHPTDRDGMISMCASIRDAPRDAPGERRYKAEHRLQHKDGTWRWSQAIGYFDVEGHRWLMMKRDVHEEKTLEQSLVQFLMTTSHDMRTPLNGISLAAQLLTDLESVRRDAESADLVSTCAACSQQLLTVVSNVLELRRLETGSYQAQVVPCSPRDLLSTVINEFKPQSALQPLRITFDEGSAANLPQLAQVDQTALTLVLKNTLSMAALRARHEVVVHAKVLEERADSSKGEHARLKVRIKHRGSMSPPPSSRRGRSSSATPQRFSAPAVPQWPNSPSAVPGAGVDLALHVSTVLTESILGGTFKKDETGFEFSVPLILHVGDAGSGQRASGTGSGAPAEQAGENGAAPQAAAASASRLPLLPLLPLQAARSAEVAAASATAAVGAGRARRVAVLVADDDAISAKLVKMQLTRLGAEVRTAANGHEALDRLCNDAPPGGWDVAFLDWHMTPAGKQRMDAPDVAASFRRWHKEQCAAAAAAGGAPPPPLPLLVALTGRTDDEAIEVARESRMMLVTKPVSAATLAATLLRVPGLRQLSY